MLLSELIEHLQDMQETMGEDTEVQVHYQPNWPLRAGVVNVTTVWETKRHDEDEQGEAEANDDVSPLIWDDERCQKEWGDDQVIIAIDGDDGYGSRRAWDR